MLSFIMIVLTMGCATVVYRVTPDSSPTMSVEAAKDAFELAMMLAKKPAGYDEFRFEGGRLARRIVGSPNFLFAGYEDIAKRVVKQGDLYTVHIEFSSAFGRTWDPFSWKSEEDARALVNAAHTLRLAKHGILAYKKPGQPPTVPDAKRLPKKGPGQLVTVPPQLPPTGEAASPVKIEKPDTAKEEPLAVAPDKKPVAVAAIPVEEAAAPRIMIVSPDVYNNKPVISKDYSVKLAGNAESRIGLAVVLINGQPVPVDEKGNFSENVLLKLGENRITVTAMDIRRNQVTEHFVISRERAQAAKALPLDAGPPSIVIISPDVTRAVSVVPRKSNVTVIGVAESKAGIADVIINGQPAGMDEKGNFSADVLVKVGKNEITVTAIDLYGRQTTKQFVVNREADKVARATKEEPAAESGLMTGKYHALLIAVQDYANPEIGKLDYPLSDARQLMAVLGSRYTFDRANITLLHNPDRRTIYKTLQSMRKQLKAEDSLLIFYAGHGMWLDDMKQGFWLPRDAAGLNDPSDWIPNSNIRDYIKAIKAKHILLIADACFSGGIFKLRDAQISPDTSMEKIYELPSRKAMTSGSLKTVPDQSVFVEFLIKRLAENKDPYLDAHKLFARMREGVIHNSRTKQTPLYGAINEAGDEGGDFIFVRKP